MIEMCVASAAAGMAAQTATGRERASSGSLPEDAHPVEELVEKVHTAA
jgi:hypothetical protein